MAAGNGVTRLELTVMSHNQRAIDLHELAGFVVEGRRSAAIRIEGEPIDELVMGKLLHPSPP